ncbi:NAD(P)H-quinone oxidoreductase [Enemella sp. A6]|uniref:NAD(P)H-quinone oxidoreductase n=1 Tax=Enemella sp. A6 TaxID=3440152 RepID=UPI003EC03725
MYAITTPSFGDPEVLTWAEVDTPTPAPGEVLIRTTAAGVNRADVLQRKGHYPPPPGVSEVIGLEVSGHVEALGEGVSDWTVGDPVVALLAGGGYAEYVVAPAGQCLPPPEGMDLVTAGAVVEVAATVLSNLDQAGLREGETFLVHGGSGGIGSFAIQYAKALGARVLTTAGSEAKLEYCRKLGADVALNYREDWEAGVAEATDGRGVDVILDNMGAKYLMPNVKALAPDGRLTVIGLQGGVKGELNLNTLLTKRASVTALSLRGRPIEQKTAICNRLRETVWPLLADGTIQPTQETRIPLREAARAHELLDSGENIGKIVLVA